MTSRIARAFRFVNERLRIDDPRPLSNFADQIVGVVQVASPMYADDELSLYAGGAISVSNGPSPIASVGLRAEVDTLVFAMWTISGATGYFFTQNAVAHDPFLNNFGSTTAKVRPQGVDSRNSIVTGRQTVAVDPNTFPSNYALGVPFMVGGTRPLVLAAGETLVWQGASGLNPGVSFAWSEFPR